MTNFWIKLTRPFTVLAPMDDVTDNVFRQVVLHAARPDIFFTEFTNADGLVHGANGVPLRKLAYTKDQHPIVAQLWGTNPENFEKAAKIVKKLGFDGIDINMGCAVRDVIKKGAGAGLIGNYELARDIIKSVKKGAKGLPVSVKTRLGNKTNIAGEWAEFLLRQDLSALTIHGRTAKQKSKGLADWEEIGKIVEMRNKIAPETLIIGNGDVLSYKEVLEKTEKYKVDGVMIGRGVFQNPWVFEKTEEKHSKKEYLNLLSYHLDLYEKNPDFVKSFATLKKFFKIYVRGFSGAGELRAKMMEAKSVEEVRSIIATTQKSPALRDQKV
jgi:tRNA-dihydrouridine synthase